LRLLRNVMEALPPAIAIRLRGNKSNRDAIGAAVNVETESGRQTRLLQAGSGFLSQHSKEIFFGLGAARGPVKVSIRWPSGLVQSLEGIPPNHRVWVEEGLDRYRVEAFRTRISGQHSDDQPQPGERLPATAETWLLVPVAAPDFSLPDQAGRVLTLSSLRRRTVLLNFFTTQAPGSQDDLAALSRFHGSLAAPGIELIGVNVDAEARNFPFPVLRGSDDVIAIYNILYRYLFDRHRDLTLPTSFLIDPAGDIVKVYQGRIDPAHVEQDLGHIPQTAAERLARALPFAGVSHTYEFGRNHLSFGAVFFQRGYYDPAGASFRLALRNDPNSAEAQYGLGSVYLKQEKAGEARDSFEQAAKLQASYPETRPNAFNNLGLLATREGRTDEAIGFFKEALRLNSDHLIALENLGNAYRQQKRWEEARATLERAVAVGPRDPEANYSLGMVFAQTGDTERAYQYLRNALEFRPAYPEALNNLGVLYLRIGRRDEAVAAFEECIRVAPAFDQSYLNLARVHSLEGHAEKARAVLLELVKQHPGHAGAQKALEELR